MRLTNIFILLFMLSAFAIGAGLYDVERENVELAINNASKTIQNISLERSGEPFSDGMMTIVESGVHFIGVSFIEVMKMGIYFGQENPDYFSPEYVFKIIKLIVWLSIIGLLIKPAFYILIFLVMGIIWLLGMRKERKENDNNRKRRR